MTDILDEADYNFNEYELKSINEIKRMVKEKAYKSREQAQEHLDYLENLANKFKHIAMDEQEAGLTSWDLKKEIDIIKRVYDELFDLVEKLPSEKKVEIKEEEEGSPRRPVHLEPKKTAGDRRIHGGE